MYLLIKQHRKLQEKCSSMLTDLQIKATKQVEEFKNLYNFNDEYFKEAENQGKKAMMIWEHMSILKSHLKIIRI